jgi:hypothetical protein
MATADEDVESFARDFVLNLIQDVHQRDNLPLNSEVVRADTRRPRQKPTPKIAPHIRVFDLGDESGWRLLHNTFVFGSGTNVFPWSRCLSILRGHEAKTAVAEEYYVDLDYRSEFASFYAHLDAQRRSSTVRVHFFSEPVTGGRVPVLTKKQARSYLGYIVCREGDLPLVSRAMIRKPSYIDESTAVTEPVHFFGQVLHIEAVPFMQQDERFAVCAQVAVWVACYTAFRRGTVERRLIADLVNLSSQVQSLRPRIPEGLPVAQVAKLFNEVGFRTFNYPTPVAALTDFPPLSAAQLGAVGDRAMDLAGEVGDAPVRPADVDVGSFVVDLYTYLNGRTPKEDDDEEHYDALKRRTNALLDELLDYLAAPYIRSGWPIYAGTSDHALVICGRRVDDSGTSYFVHDDQTGPYLAAASLVELSREGLECQAGIEEPETEDAGDLPAPRIDDGLDCLTRMRAGEFDDIDRAIYSIVIPCPPRVLLPASEAHSHALELVGQFAGEVDLQNSGSALLDAHGTRVSLLMGIDYKQRRREYARKHKDPAGGRVFASVQLAEWVLLVEGTTDGGMVLWEVVYDASSGGGQPRMQLVRMLERVIAVYPKFGDFAESSTIATTSFPPCPIPSRVAKTLL